METVRFQKINNVFTTILRCKRTPMLPWHALQRGRKGHLSRQAPLPTIRMKWTGLSTQRFWRCLTALTKIPSRGIKPVFWIWVKYSQMTVGDISARWLTEGDALIGKWILLSLVLTVLPMVQVSNEIQSQIFQSFNLSLFHTGGLREAAWPSGQRVGLAIRRSRVRVPLWPLAGFVLGRPEFKFSTTLVNSQLVAFYQLGFLIL